MYITATNPCSSAQCSHLCALSSGTVSLSYRCLCEDGYIPDVQSESKRCIKVDGQNNKMLVYLYAQSVSTSVSRESCYLSNQL